MQIPSSHTHTRIYMPMVFSKREYTYTHLHDPCNGLRQKYKSGKCCTSIDVVLKHNLVIVLVVLMMVCKSLGVVFKTINLMFGKLNTFEYMGSWCKVNFPIHFIVKSSSAFVSQLVLSLILLHLLCWILYVKYRFSRLKYQILNT